MPQQRKQRLREHPTQKLERFQFQMANISTEEESVVLNPRVGDSMTVVYGIRYCRSAIGICMDGNLIADAKRRIVSENNQSRLF